MPSSAARRIKMKGCPPGVLCLSSQLVFFLLAAAIIGVLVLMTIRGTASNPAMRPAAAAHQKPIHISIMSSPQQASGDSRYSMPPQPYKSWLSEPEFPPRGGLAHIPIGIPTRGLPDKFQSMGVMTTPDGDILPLYGRRTGGSNDRWNYYTRTDTYNPVPIPLKFDKRDCMDDVGCNEIMDGDEVTSAVGKSGRISIYKNDGPKYIPGLI